MQSSPQVPKQGMLGCEAIRKAYQVEGGSGAD